MYTLTRYRHVVPRRNRCTIRECKVLYHFAKHCNCKLMLDRITHPYSKNVHAPIGASRIDSLIKLSSLLNLPMEALDHPSFSITACTSCRKGSTYSECVAKSNRACVRTYRKFYKVFTWCESECNYHRCIVDGCKIDEEYTLCYSPNRRPLPFGGLKQPTDDVILCISIESE